MTAGKTAKSEGARENKRDGEKANENESLKKKMLSYSCHPSVTAGTVLVSQAPKGAQKKQ